MSEKADAIVVGLGGVGAAALYHLAKRGVRALGLDRFPPGHARGSSHGDSRVIRLAYFEHPDYVPLLRRAYGLWSELEKAAGLTLYHETGLLQAGSPDGEVVPGVLRAAKLHGLEVESLSAAEASRRFPGFRVPDAMAAVFEKRAGYLRVESCVRAHAKEAQKLGARMATEETVTGWRAGPDSVEVRCGGSTYSAARLILAPGAWAPQLLSDIGVSFQVLRKPFFWFRSGHAFAAKNGCPVFLFETPSGVFYGIPRTGRRGLKAAEHTGGSVVEDPLKVSRRMDPADLARVRGFMSAYLPKAGRRLEAASVCLYTMTGDQNFIVDRHPRHPNVVFAAGLSGHGFKFTSVLGEALAELAVDGRNSLPIKFLGLQRKGLKTG
jgi:sarcosine oxidase